MFNMFKKAAISNRVEETILYEYVLDELEDGFKVRGLWGKALAMSEGDENKATSLYMQYRVQNIKDYFTTLKITYEELSKTQIKSSLENNFISDQSTDNFNVNPENIFLEKYNCNRKSINIEITDDYIIVKRGRENNAIFDRKKQIELNRIKW